MIRTLLIANRGEIAARIARTAREMGIRTVAVYSDADRDALHVRACDEAVHIGPAPAAESYLQTEKILDAAARAGADAVHPGYGFLSENAAFAEACANAGVIFVGPPADAIRAMGLKDRAKALMAEAGVPVVPGYHGAEQEPHFLEAEAQKIGYPVLIKASAGGGGKGMRKVDTPAVFEKALAAAQREAKAAFGDTHVLIEKFVDKPRHIEIQVFTDGHGNAVHLYERDCSLQRRHQKVVEEAPAPGMPAEMRAAMGEAAVRAAKAIGYVGAGTVEFIADGRGGLKSDQFFFMEMNTRLQVEHPVTEAITGTDLVRWQLDIAAGGALAMKQEDIPLEGHAVEVRLYAEDPTRNFLPSTGTIERLRLPGGIRADMGVEEGDAVSMFYDPMIGKLIAHGATREAALGRLEQALGRTQLLGPKNNLGFLKRVLAHEAFRAGDVDTGFIEQHGAELAPQPLSSAEQASGVAALLAARERKLGARAATTADPWSPWATGDNFVLGGFRAEEMKLLVSSQPVSAHIERQSGDDVAVEIDGSRHELTYRRRADDRLEVVVDGHRASYAVAFQDETRVTLFCRDGEAVSFALAPLDAAAGEADVAAGSLEAPMPGKIVSVHIAVGDTVTAGQTLLVMEAMKMEQTILAPRAGRVAEIMVAGGDQVAAGRLLVRLDDEA